MAAAAIVAARRAKEKGEEEPEKTSKELLKEAIEEEAEGKYQVPEYKDPSKHTGWKKSYLSYTIQANTLVRDDPFNNFIIFIILCAGVVVGIQTDPDLEEATAVVICDTVILGIFILECVLKSFAEGLRPWMYLFNDEWRWNNFDFWIVVLSCMPSSLFPASGFIALLRLVRLARMFKLVKKVPQLQMIVMGLLGGVKSIGYIFLLLFLVFYLFANVGILMFRENDPWHFGELFLTLLTLFRCATLEDWTDVMYINIYGCDSDMYATDIYTTDNSSANGIGVLYCDPEKSTAQPWPSVMYFFIFVNIAAMIMLSLFIGAVTMSMTESMENMKKLQREDERKKQLLKAQKKAEEEEAAAL